MLFSQGQAVCWISGIYVLASDSIGSLMHAIWLVVYVCVCVISVYTRGYAGALTCAQAQSPNEDCSVPFNITPLRLSLTEPRARLVSS